MKRSVFLRERAAHEGRVAGASDSHRSARDRASAGRIERRPWISPGPRRDEAARGICAAGRWVTQSRANDATKRQSEHQNSLISGKATDGARVTPRQGPIVRMRRFARHHRKNARVIAFAGPPDVPWPSAGTVEANRTAGVVASLTRRQQ